MLDRKRQVRATVFRGEMGSGKSTAAKLYNDEVLLLPEECFFEGDTVLQLPELADLKQKVDANEALKEHEVKRLTEAYTREVVRRAKEKPTTTAQALYFNADCKALEDAFVKEFGSKESIAFVWVTTPAPKHYAQLFSREFSKYFTEHSSRTESGSLVEGIMNSLTTLKDAFLSGVRSMKTNMAYSEYFEKPAGYFKDYSSWVNYKKGIKTTDAVEAFKINNSGDTAALLTKLRSLPIEVKASDAKQSSTAPILTLIKDAEPAAIVKLAATPLQPLKTEQPASPRAQVLQKLSVVGGSTAIDHPENSVREPVTNLRHPRAGGDT